LTAPDRPVSGSASRWRGTRRQLKAGRRSVDDGAVIGSRGNEPVEPDPRVGPPRSKLLVLLAEDIPVNQRVGQLMLEKLGHTVHVVANGQQAVEMVARVRFDVVLMDVQMPVMGGLDATRAIRACAGAVHQPRIIAMSADMVAEDRDACRAAGMDGSVSKPLSLARLADVFEDSRPRTVPQLDAPLPGRSGRNSTLASVDAQILAALVDQVAGEDTNGRSQLIDIYLGDADRRIDDLAAAVRVDDPDGFARAAHGLRSGTALVGALRLADLLTRSETMARTGISDLRTIGEEIETEYHEVTATLQRMRQSA
jgi:CheY-like chemotaxis protein